MQLLTNHKQALGWKTHHKREDPTQDGFWSEDELAEDPNLRIDTEHRFLDDLCVNLELSGAIKLRDKKVYRRDKYGDIKEEISCIVYQQGINLYFIRCKTEYISPDMPDISLVDETIRIRNYLNFGKN